MVFVCEEECGYEVDVHMPKKNVGYEDKHNNSTVCSLE